MKVRLGLFVLYGVLAFFVNQYAWMALRHGQNFYALVTLPGTFLHEAAHYIAALCTNGSPSGFSILPTWDASGNQTSMGHIYSYHNWYNAAIIGTAPLLLAPLTAFFIALAARTLNPLKVIFWCWIASCTWQSITPSTADLSVAPYYTSWIFAVPFLLIGTWITYRVTRKTLGI